MDAKTKAEADELLEKLATLLGSSAHDDGRNKSFDEMELAANAIGDRLSAKVLQRLSLAVSQVGRGLSVSEMQLAGEAIGRA